MFLADVFFCFLFLANVRENGNKERDRESKNMVIIGSVLRTLDRLEVLFNRFGIFDFL